MKNLFLLSLFGLFMAASLGGQTPESISLTTSAYANEESDNSANNSTETGNNDTANSSAETGNTDETTANSGETSSNESSSDNEANNSAFHCPAGITTCYTANGEEYTDVNNLAASAAGPEGGDSEGETVASVVKPSHFRSF